MPERWRSKVARDLVARVRKAGGTAERTGTGRIRVTGPDGSITVHEPSSETRRDLRREGAFRKIRAVTGLEVGDD